MDYPELSKKNIYCIPVGDFWGRDPYRLFLIYAPFIGSYMLATPHLATSLNQHAKNGGGDEAVASLYEKLCGSSNRKIDRMRHDTKEVYQVDILANNTCNFHCVYCYSAAGRSQQRLRMEHVKTLIDYLFSKDYTPSAPYAIHFSGGGEPLLSLDVIKETIDYIKQAHSKGNGHPYSLGIVTNGSLLVEDVARYLCEENIEIIISFEILESLQNKERGHYDLVVENIDRLTELDIPFAIRTTFTHESTEYMCEMVREVYYRFPGIHFLTFDVVLSADLFKTPLELKDYYDSFLDNYYKAKALAAEFGISIACLAAEPFHMLRDRTCTGKLVLTPWGKLSACSRVSSPQEAHYADYESGKIENGRVVIDEERFSEIMEDCNIYSQDICHECFARWNCGGGCRLFHHSFDESFEKVRCDFVRKALRQQLLYLLKKNFRQSMNQDLMEYIAHKIERNEL